MKSNEEALNNGAPTPTPAVGSSPKAQCLGLGGVNQGAKNNANH